jgi:hypothetical protein
MDDDQDQCRHHKGRDNDGYSLHRPRPKLTADDASTVMGIYVGLLVMLAGALVSSSASAY